MGSVANLDFKSAVDYVLSFADYERISRSAVVFDLARIECLLQRFGNPHRQVGSIHVAGTKGKGSTSAMIAGILTSAGYRTGLYTSPHLLSIRERIQVDGCLIEEDEFARTVDRLRPHMEATNASAGLGELTTFEILTALAFLHFCTQKVDYQVLETGLGGRLDATNVVVPEVAVLTSISLDHTEVLGNTITKIAAEKAGIIKEGATVVCAPQVPEADEVIEDACRRMHATLVKIGRDVDLKVLDCGPSGQRLALRTASSYYEVHIPLLGEFQAVNAACAVAAAETLAARDADITPQAISEGLRQVRWPGRLQVLGQSPYLVVDGAHNDDSTAKLMAALREYFSFDRLIVVIGISHEKNMAGIVREIARASSSVIVTKADHPRAAKQENLIEQFARAGVQAVAAGNTREALRMALDLARPNDLICATGSLFIVAEIMRLLQEPHT